MAGLLAKIFRRMKEKKQRDTQKHGKEFLKKVAIFDGLTDEELEKVWSIVKEIRVPAGTTIIKDGEIGDSMFFFVEGIVNVTKTLTLKLDKSSFGNVDKSMITLNSNLVSFFGDMAMFEDAPRSATITAETDCILYEMMKDDFEHLCNNYLELGLKILRRIATVLCHRIRKANQDVVKLSTALSIALSK